MHKPNYTLLFVTLALFIFGLIILSSASALLAWERSGETGYYLKRQLLFGILLGLPLMLILSKFHYGNFKKLSSVLFVASLVLLVLVFIPQTGLDLGGAKRWIKIGSFSFQPAELVKISFIVYLAAWLEKRGEKIRSFREGVIPFLITSALVGGLIALQPDIGTMSLILICGVILFFIAGAKILHILFLGMCGLGTLGALVKLAPYRLNRFIVYLHPEIDPRGIGYQINQALLAIGSGGILGLGLGQGRQKYQFLPEPATDSIFAILGEELGFIGILILISLFIAFAIKGFGIAKNAPDLFSKLLACGITSWIIIQAFVHIGGVSSLVPLTGITLPFISYGGTALVVSLAGVGILLNISRYTVEKVRH